MEVLKFLVLVIVLAICGGVFGADESSREGRCDSQPQPVKVTFVKKAPNRHHHHQKVIPGHGPSGHKFHSRKKPVHQELKPLMLTDYPSSSDASASANDFHVIPPRDSQHQQQQQPSKTTPDASNAESDIGSDFDPSVGFAPRLSISPSGDISFARSLSFHEEDLELDQGNHGHNHEHMDEDHDHFHKIRHARAAGVKEPPSRLSSTLGWMQGEGAQTLNSVGAGNQATASDQMNLQASGLNVEAAHTGNSAATGSGTISATGFTSVTNSGSGWKSR